MAEYLVSSLTYTIAHYVVSKAIGKHAALQALVDFHAQITTIAVDDKVIEHARQAGLPDFEDAVQLFAALAAGADAVVTRDPKGFSTQLATVLDPIAALIAIPAWLSAFRGKQITLPQVSQLSPPTAPKNPE